MASHQRLDRADDHQAKRDELKATLTTYRELAAGNPVLEDALIKHLLEQMEELVEAHVDVRVNARIDTWVRANLGVRVSAVVEERVDARFEALAEGFWTRLSDERRAAGNTWPYLVVPPLSLLLGVPLIAVAGGTAGLLGFLAALVVVLAVNYPNLLAVSRPRPRQP